MLLRLRCGAKSLSFSWISPQAATLKSYYNLFWKVLQYGVGSARYSVEATHPQVMQVYRGKTREKLSGRFTSIVYWWKPGICR